MRATLLACFIAASFAQGDPVPSPTPTLATPPAPAPNTSAPAPGLLNQKYLLGNFWGERSKLEDEGFTLAPTYTAETFGNPIGGVKQGAIYEGLLDLELTLDFKKMVDWDGSFHVSSYYPMGNGLTGSDTHDLFVVSDIDAYDTLHLWELWYEQKLGMTKSSLRVGQMGADQEFFISTNAANFLNSTYGWPAILGSNAPTPNYAYAAPGVRLQLDPDAHWRFLEAVYAGNPAPDRLGDPIPTALLSRRLSIIPAPAFTSMAARGSSASMNSGTT